jgi:hypothetical protein
LEWLRTGKIPFLEHEDQMEDLVVEAKYFGYLELAETLETDLNLKWYLLISEY